MSQTPSLDAQIDTQASSASTFGIPTTPKTTPFLTTPNPLSPIGGSQEDVRSSSNSKNILKDNLQTVNIIPKNVNLIASRMTAGMRLLYF